MFSISPNVRAVADQDGAVLLDTQHGAMITLNATGSYIWNKLQIGRSLDEIVHDLASDTGEAPFAIANDVRQFLDQLLASQLIVPC